MKKYITNEELRDIVADLADAFMGNERYDFTISLSHYTSSSELGVQIQDRESSYKMISSESYRIIEKPHDSLDIVGAIKTTIEKYEAEMAKINSKDESPIEL